MKPLQEETNATDFEAECAPLLMDVVPLVMHRIRTEMRSHRTPGLSLPQFRTLIYLYRNEGASLSQVADRIGLSLSSMSKIVDSLLTRRLVIRRVLPDDRRYMSLKLSARGLTELTRTRQITEARLAEVLAALSPAQQASLVEALQTLRSLFAPERLPGHGEGK
jgi:DNA-binding MarR family transcriptional regulator